MIKLHLSNSSTSLDLVLPSPPLQEDVIEGATDITTLDNNVSTYLTTNKRQWTQGWDFMAKDDFDALKAFYDAQWTEYKYPLLTIDYFSISNVPVRMTLGSRQTIDNCGEVQDVSVTFRETRQLP